MFQSLSEPLFAVPFLAALGFGVLGVLVGAGYGWMALGRAESRLAELSARLGGLGLAGIGLSGVAVGFDYAGTQARLLAGTDIAPSLWGRIGLSLPWEVVAAGLGVLALTSVVAAMGLAGYAGYAD
jgi:hypothetical protein